jgi:hypothetical protein
VWLPHIDDGWVVSTARIAFEFPFSSISFSLTTNVCKCSFVNSPDTKISHLFSLESLHFLIFFIVTESTPFTPKLLSLLTF